MCSPSIIFALCSILPYVIAEPKQEVLVSSLYGSDLEQWNLSFVPPDSWTFPYAPGMKAFDKSPAIFEEYLYKGEPKDNKPWITNTEARDPDIFPWMNQRIGDANLIAAEQEKEFVADKRNPNWRWSESWRIINLYNQFINTRSAKPGGNGRVVSEYFSTLGSTALAKGLFPTDVQILLTDNERIIVGSTEEWVGNLTASPPYSPFTGVRVTSGRDLKFTQKGPVGPMSLEASFILATQLAGINWQTLRTKLDNNALLTGVYWVSGIVPDKSANVDQLILERRGNQAERTLGYLSRRGAPLTGSPDAGFYIVLDIDPKVDGYSDPRKKVFVYASHVMDEHSHIYIPNQKNLKNMQYVGDYNPAQWEGIVKKIDKKENEKNKGKDVRFFAHGHAAILPFQTFMKWLGQTIPNKGPGEAMPKYDQIGEMHLYYLPEDEDDVWPRRAYLQSTGTIET